MSISRIVLLGAVALCAGCAGISLSDEVDELKTASGSFGESLRTLQSALPGDALRERADAEDSLLNNGLVMFSDRCEASVVEANAAFDEELRQYRQSGYRQAFFDRAYRRLHGTTLCDLQSLDAPTLAQVAQPAETEGSIDGPGGVEVDDLGQASRALDRYVRALADLASNTSGQAHDDARDGVFSAGGALLTAFGVPFAAPVAGLLGEIVANIEQARRNARIAEYLRAFDRIMPHIMERMGHAGRLANLQLAMNQARAAATLSQAANLAINGPVARNGRRRMPTPHDRLTAYGFYAPRIAERNAALAGLRRADPMAAARAFAVAHHELTEAYTSRRARVASLSAGLQSLGEAAQDLRDAIDKAEED